MDIVPPPPPLATLHQRPSWVNLAGRVDRSACAELRASEVWPHVQFNRPPREAARGTYSISAHVLHRLHTGRLPRHLRGDFRTSKSNVMRRTLPSPPGRGAAAESTKRKHIRIHDPGPAFNPNKGATFRSGYKMLGLWADWSQTIRVERRPLHQRLAQHFLICPNALSLSKGEGGGVGSQHCLGKVMKLFMPLCTPREAADADLAEGWINLLDARRNIIRIPLPPSLMAQRAQLINRYGLLFRTGGGRQLLCRNCLGLRYGSCWALRKGPNKRS